MKYNSNIVIIISMSHPPATKSSAGANFGGTGSTVFILVWSPV